MILGTQEDLCFMELVSYLLTYLLTYLPVYFQLICSNGFVSAVRVLFTVSEHQGK